MMKMIIFGVLISLTSLIFTEEKSKIEEVQPTPLAGMRGLPSNIPDISIIGDFYGKISNLDTDTERNRLTIRGIELTLQGYVYPKIRADVSVAMHKHEHHTEAEICEAKVSFLKLFNNFTAEVGKILINFGKINKIHQHHRPYVDQPQVITNFFGPHGLVGEGILLSYLLPVKIFCQVDVGMWQLTSFNHNDAENHEEHKFAVVDLAYNSKLWLSFPITAKSELEVGINGLLAKGPHYKKHKDEVKVAGIDLTYKLWPSAYNRFIFQNEILYLIREVEVGTMKRLGFYSYLGYRFNKYWSLGLRYDDAEDAILHKNTAAEEDVSLAEKTKAISIILTRNLTETTLLRGGGKYYFEGMENVYEGYLQIVFGIGPHSHMLE